MNIMNFKSGSIFTVLVFLLCLSPGFIHAQPSDDVNSLRIVFLGGQQGELQPCG